MTRLRRWVQWQLAIAAWIGAARKETNFGLTAKYEFDSLVDPLPRRAVARCEKHGFDKQMTFEAARAKVRGNFGDWRAQHGLRRFEAPSK